MFWYAFLSFKHFSNGVFSKSVSSSPSMYPSSHFRGMTYKHEFSHVAFVRGIQIVQYFGDSSSRKLFLVPSLPFGCRSLCGVNAVIIVVLFDSPLFSSSFFTFLTRHTNASKFNRFSLPPDISCTIFSTRRAKIQ